MPDERVPKDAVEPPYDPEVVEEEGK